MNASKIVLIVHFGLAHPPLFGYVHLAMELLLGVESVPVLGGDVLRLKYLVGFPTFSVQICVVLRVAAG